MIGQTCSLVVRQDRANDHLPFWPEPVGTKLWGMRPNQRRRKAAQSSPQPSSAAINRSQYLLLCLVVACQFVTVLITWPVWNVRTDPPNLPLIPLPDISFGIPIVATLIAALIWPVRGVAAHAVLYLLACIWDQYRLQPQVISLLVLMFACVSQQGLWFGRWYLAAMWLWAGIHKFLSPDWFGWSSWVFLNDSGLPADSLHVYFAALVATAEVALGLVAIFAPKRAAIPCLIMHLTILLLLSPLVRNFNPSVWPWNFASGIAGWWILRQQADMTLTRWHYATVAALLIVPAGFYADLVNPHLAFVLYSGNMPTALHTGHGYVRRLDGWAGLTVPFPDSPRLFVQFFRQTAAPGEKLVISDPRPWLPDRYFVKQTDGQVQEIDRSRFLHIIDGFSEVPGRQLEGFNAVWAVERTGVVLQRDEYGSILAATIQEERSLAAANQLRELPNLKELRLNDVNVTNQQLSAFGKISTLEIFETTQCSLTGVDLSHLRQLSALKWLHLEDANLTSDQLDALTSVPALEVLHLPRNPIDDRGLALIGSLEALTWLDLSHTKISSVGLRHLGTLRVCTWLTLSSTAVGDEGLQDIAHLPYLEVLELADTKVSSSGLRQLGELKKLEHLDLNGTAIDDEAIESLAKLKTLKRLDLRDTRLTSEGVMSLRRDLPECEISF